MAKTQSHGLRTMGFLIIMVLVTACKASQASSPTTRTLPSTPTLSGRVTVGKITEVILSDDAGDLNHIIPRHTRLEGDVLYTFVWQGESAWEMESCCRPIAIDLPGGQIHDLATEAKQGQWPISRQRYLVREADKIYVFDLQTGEETVLGGEGRWLSHPAVSGSTVVWGEKNITSTLGTDIYAYDMATGQVFTITHRAGGQMKPVIEGEWIVYKNRVIDDPRDLIADIYLHNITTGEDRLLGTNRFAADATEEVYAIANGRVVWNEWPAGEWQDGKWYEEESSLHVYELSSGVEWVLDSSNRAPFYFVLSGDLLLGGGGYDFAQDTSFDIPQEGLPDTYQDISPGIRRVIKSRAVYVSETRMVWLIGTREESNIEYYLTPGIPTPTPVTNIPTPGPIHYRLFTASIER